MHNVTPTPTPNREQNIIIAQKREYVFYELGITMII